MYCIPDEFNYRNLKRNSVLLSQGYKPPGVVSTGTTIAAVHYKDGIVLGADQRIVNGNIATVSPCKVQAIAENIYCAGAGVHADVQKIISRLESELELHRLNLNYTHIPVIVAKTKMKSLIFQSTGLLNAGFVIAGVDSLKGFQIYTIHSSGASNYLPYTTFGSGSIAAMSILEEGWRKELNEDQAIDLVFSSVYAGIDVDLGSGEGIDICVICRTGAKELLSYRAGQFNNAMGREHKFSRTEQKMPECNLKITECTEDE